MLVEVEERELVTLPERFIWLTLRQIGRLLKRDNIIHACTRSILSSLVIPATQEPISASDSSRSKTCRKSSFAEIIQWIDNNKATNHFHVTRIPLNSLKEWSMDRDGSFSHEYGRYFRVVGINVESNEREVSTWDQPILDNPGTGIIGLLTKTAAGERYFLMQAKAEPGNRGIVQIGPTVQFTPGNYIGNEKIPKPFLFNEFYHPEQFGSLLESIQSEEGARFYQEAHLHRILSLPENCDIAIPDDFRWISQSDLHSLINMGDTVNSCARSVFSLVLSLEVKK
jgi:oxidase EvaA